MNKSINQIKKELRFIKSNQKAIDTYIEAEKHYQERLSWLSARKQTASIQKDIMRNKEILNVLQTKFDIKKLQELEVFYIDAINQLEEEYDKLVLMKVYIQNHTFWRASQELCYSVDGLKDRAKRAIVKLKMIIERG